MANLTKVFQYLAWPVTFGLLLAVLYLQLNPPTAAPSTTSSPQAVVANTVPAVSTGAAAPTSYADAVEKAIPAVVNIYTRTRVQSHSPYDNDPFFRFFFNRPGRERVQSALGSGVIVSEEGYLLTSHHIVEQAETIVVLLNDGRESLARVVGSDPEIDLCVLKIELDDLSPVQFGNVDVARVGDVVLAIGNPYGLGQTVTQGVISASSRNGLQLTTNYIQTDAAINPGNSGGALIDASGKLLGINTSILNTTGSSIGIGFAIPADTAMKVLEDIKTYGHVVRGALGIVPKAVPGVLARRLGLASGQGILITAIYQGSPAHMAGMMPGDIIMELDGRPITGDRVGLDAIGSTTPGKEIPIVILRQGEQHSMLITPGAR